MNLSLWRRVGKGAVTTDVTSLFLRAMSRAEEEATRSAVANVSVEGCMVMRLDYEVVLSSMGA